MPQERRSFWYGLIEHFPHQRVIAIATNLEHRHAYESHSGFEKIGRDRAMHEMTAHDPARRDRRIEIDGKAYTGDVFELASSFKKGRTEHVINLRRPGASPPPAE